MFTGFENLAFALRFVWPARWKCLALQHYPAAHSHYHLDSHPALYFKTMESTYMAPTQVLLDLCTITWMPAGRRVKMRRPLDFANAINSTSSSAALSYFL
jgi:hypothetical protein